MAKKKEEKAAPVIAVTLEHPQRFNNKRYEPKRYTREDDDFLAVLNGVRRYPELVDAGHAELEYETEAT